MSKNDEAINPIELVGAVRMHGKASERYQDVVFHYEDAESLATSIPIEYRRTGVDLHDPLEIEEYLAQAHSFCHPNNRTDWREEQIKFWDAKPGADVTKPFFDAMLSFGWACSCEFPANPNPQRRIQDIKESGYTLSSYPNRPCSKCGTRKIAHLLVPLPRGGVSGYEAWSPELRKRIVDALGGYDAYEAKVVKKEDLLPDHKFPEIRWDDQTRRQSLEGLSVDEMRRDFQLMSNQRNLQKREVCRQCYQTGKRSCPYGVKFYAVGNENWPADIPRTGKRAEDGGLGCGWYDIDAWRKALNRKLAVPADELAAASPLPQDEPTLGTLPRSSGESE